MKKKLLACLVAGSVMVASTAMATTLTSYTHNYGSQTGRTNPGGNDVLSAGYVTVSDQSTDRFNDSFDFSALSYSSINHFDLTLTYSGVDTYQFFSFKELWYARPGGTPDQYTSFRLNPSSNSVTQTFVINSSLTPEFNQMVNNKNFFFWFAEDSSGPDNFNLYSAVLTVDGQASAPVPEPGTMMLLGFGMLGLAVYGKRRMNKEA